MDQQELLGSLDIEGEAPLSFCRGISSPQIDEIIYYAHYDDSVKKFTSDPERFKDKNAFMAWMQKGRSIYTLSDSNGKLAGIIWFGPKEMPYRAFIEPLSKDHYGVTFSIRIYGSWRGKHLARRFTTMAFAEYKKSAEYQNVSNKAMWLETTMGNDSAIAAYEHFGFRKVTTPDQHNKILMVME